MGSDTELDGFKRLNLVDFAKTMGYQIDRDESSKQSIVLRKGDDKVIVKAPEHTEHWVYCSVRDESDHGSILDFIRNRTGENLGNVRKMIRGHARDNPSLLLSPVLKADVPASQGQDGYRKKAAAVWKAARWEPEPVYLVGRGLSSLTMTADRFTDTFRVDRSGNVLFPHFDRVGMCGYEIRRADFKGFGKDVKKALWYSNNLKTAESIVLCESPIDCFSHFQLHSGESAYVAIGGTPSALQRDLLTGLLLKAADRGVKVYCAFDNDSSGNEYHSMMELLSPQPLERLTPVGKDWNEDLINGNRYSICS